MSKVNKKTKVTTKKVFGKSKTVAAAVSNGEIHAAAVKALHVMLLPDSGGWFAQGLEIDYFACGPTLERAKEYFANGLCLTVNEHLKMYGNIDSVLTPASKADWEAFYKATPAEVKKETLNFVTACKGTPTVKHAEKALGFDVIQFIARKMPVAAAC